MNSRAALCGALAAALLIVAACWSKLLGKCDSNADCKGESVCRQGLCVCVPETVGQHCESVGRACGVDSWIDNCGQERNEVCGVCPSCAESDEEHCAQLGGDCGPTQWTDRCGVSRNADCGCPLPQVCGAGGRIPGKCGCDLVNRPAPTDWTNWRAIPIPPPKEAYSTINAQGDVLDSQTCLIWQRDVQTNPSPHSGDTNAQNFYWKEARDHCVKQGGGWRLPTKVELESIVDYNQISPAINTNFFGQPKAGPGGWFWTATPYADGDFKEDGSGGSACYVNFNSGDSYWNFVYLDNFVRCVR